MTKEWDRDEESIQSTWRNHETYIEKHEIEMKRSWDLNEESRNLWINRCDLEEESIRSTWKDHDI